VRRLVVILASLALFASGCGGGGGKAQSHSVLEVSKAFYDAGLPFTGVVTGNQYVTGQVPFLPLALNQSDMRFNVQAQLSGSNTSFHTGEVVWVFDTNAHAQQALAAVPLAKWGTGPQHIVREQLGNVVVVASGFVGTPKAKLDQALAALR
jgi:hypothetical protein